MNNRVSKIYYVIALTASLILSSTSAVGDRYNRQEWQQEWQDQSGQKNWHHDRRHGGGASIYLYINSGLYNGSSYYYNYYNQPFYYQQCGWVATQYDFSGNVLTAQWVCQ
jgi:hypothetical protein